MSQDFADLDKGAAQKVTQLHRLSLTGVLLGELIQQFMQRQSFGGVDESSLRRVVDKFDALAIAAAFFRLPRAGGVNQNAPHRLRGRRKEMPASFKSFVASFLMGEPQIGFIHKRRSTPGMRLSFASQPCRRELL